MRINYEYRFRKKSMGLSITALVLLSLLILAVSLISMDKAESEVKINKRQVLEKEKEPRALIIEYSNIYAVDPKLAIAISRLETGNWTSEAYTKGSNFGGLTVNDSVLKYETKEEGVKRYIENLHDVYISQGLDTPKKIAPVYCPANEKVWAREVSRIMDEER